MDQLHSIYPSPETKQDKDELGEGSNHWLQLFKIKRTKFKTGLFPLASNHGLKSGGKHEGERGLLGQTQQSCSNFFQTPNLTSCNYLTRSQTPSSNQIITTQREGFYFWVCR